MNHGTSALSRATACVSRCASVFVMPSPAAAPQQPVVSQRRAADRPDGHASRTRTAADRRPDREGLHRHRGRRAADDQLRRVPARCRTSGRARSRRRHRRRRRQRRPATSRRRRAGADLDVLAAGRHPVPRPPAAGAVFRSDGDAAARSDARLRRRAEVHRHADAAVGSAWRS